jgi:DNA-directed RNA polymerase specialized sigma24 family protein
MLRETIERRRVAWEQDLVAGMRRDEPEAYKEFFQCFRPLLIAEARRLRVQPALCQELADECLDDVAMRLRRYTTPIPRSLAPYLVRALRIHRLALRRDERRRASGEQGGDTSDNDPDAPFVSALSQDTLRASAGPDGERTPASTALERLASMVEEGLSREEELLLSWVSRWVPQSDIAQWLGISHGAARNRVMRLRARLKEVALQHAATFTGRERAELGEFFRRTFATARAANGNRTESGAAQRDAETQSRRVSSSREDL